MRLGKEVSNLKTRGDVGKATLCKKMLPNKMTSHLYVLVTFVEDRFDNLDSTLIVTL